MEETNQKLTKFQKLLPSVQTWKHVAIYITRAIFRIAVLIIGAISGSLTIADIFSNFN